jgi:hypothetical protein
MEENHPDKRQRQGFGEAKTCYTSYAIISPFVQ